MAIKNYRSDVPYKKTLSELQQFLGEKGADEVKVKYEEIAPGKRIPVVITFTLTVGKAHLDVRYPCNWKGAREQLRQIPASRLKRAVTDDLALSVAWRIVKDTIEANIAFVEAEQGELLQIFLPYVVTPGGVTVYEEFVQRTLLAEGTNANRPKPLPG